MVIVFIPLFFILTEYVQAMILVNEATISNSSANGMFIAYSNPNISVFSLPILIWLIKGNLN